MSKIGKRKDTFINGVIALMLSQIAIRVLGMVYSLYLTNKNGFGDSGNAICMASYQVYAIFLTISSIGIPNAVSKIIAQNYFNGETGNCKKIFYIAIIFFAFIGIILSGILFISSNFISNNILGLTGDTGGIILKILAPSIVFVSINAVLKGYYNGIQKINISAKVQVIEQVAKTIFTIIIVEIIARYTGDMTEYMAEGSMIAASLSTIIGVLYSILKYRKIRIIGYGISTKSIINILKELLSLAIPISLASFMIVLENNIDSITIIRILKEKIGENAAKEEYGIITSKVDLLVGLSASLNGAIAMALIPEISKLNSMCEILKMEKKIDLAVTITLVISVPITLIIIIFSKEIIYFLYPNANKGYELLRLACITIPVTALTQVMDGILQGIGDAKYQLKAIMIRNYM